MKMVDIAGRRFGNLTAIARVGSKRTYGGSLITMWMTRCDCGHEKARSYSNLKTGRVLSCARPECAISQTHGNRGGKGAEDAGLRQIFGWYRLKAKRKNRTFTISIEDVGRIIKSNCHYCGAPPSNIARYDSRFAAMYYSGIDRVLNGEGYSASNVVPCCGTCNSMKRVLPVDEFLAHIQRIIAHCFQ